MRVLQVQLFASCGVKFSLCRLLSLNSYLMLIQKISYQTILANNPADFYSVHNSQEIVRQIVKSSGSYKNRVIANKTCTIARNYNL